MILSISPAARLLRAVAAAIAGLLPGCLPGGLSGPRRWSWRMGRRWTLRYGTRQARRTTPTSARCPTSRRACSSSASPSITPTASRTSNPRCAACTVICVRVRACVPHRAVPVVCPWGGGQATGQGVKSAGACVPTLVGCVRVGVVRLLVSSCVMVGVVVCVFWGGGMLMVDCAAYSYSGAHLRSCSGIPKSCMYTAVVSKYLWPPLALTQAI